MSSIPKLYQIKMKLRFNHIHKEALLKNKSLTIYTVKNKYESKSDLKSFYKSHFAGTKYDLKHGFESAFKSVL